MIERDVRYELVRGDAMVDELEKMAGVGSLVSGLARRIPAATKNLGAAGKGRLAGTLTGAGVGAVGGASANPEDRTGGALSGALLGGVTGLGAGQLATKAGRREIGHVGKRQIHGVTGYMPRTAKQRARGVGWSGKGMSTDERVESLKGIGFRVGEKAKDRPKAVQKAMAAQSLASSLPTSMRRGLAKAEVSGLQAQRRAVEQGLTSLPGVAKGLVRNPLGTLKTGIVSQGPIGVGLAALPLATELPQAVKGEGSFSSPGGMGRFVGENAGYVALGALPVAPMMAGASLAGRAGQMIHRGLKGKQGRVTPPQGQYYYD